MVATRLMTRLREHDWLAVVIELLVVVLGILIALQVSNWNQARLDRARAHDYYARIHAELSTDLKTMDVTLAFWTRVSGYGQQAIAHGETGALVDRSNWKTVLAYYQASQTFPFVETSSAYTEMRTAGELGLIADQTLRTQLEGYYSLSGVGGQSIIHEQAPVYRQQVRGLTPWPVQQYIWSHCFRESSFLAQEFVDCPSPISERDAATILARYEQSPTLLGNLRYWMSQLGVSSLVLVNDRREANGLANEVARQGKLRGSAQATTP
jgi:hypothetical protein